ncbi:hypothetical protein ACFL4G_06325 [Thermodesulfobacteriota bacterium]
MKRADHGEGTREVVLMFSGGYDSTITALQLAEQFDRIHLVTFRSYGLVGVSHSEKHLRELRREFGSDRFIHEYMDVRSLQRRIFSGFFEDYGRYCDGGAPGIVCLSCKLAMHACAAGYCLDHGIPCLADGANRTQSDHPEDMPGVMNVLRRFYMDLGVVYLSPIYDSELSASGKRRYLRDRGYSTGVWLGQSSRTIQPLCLIGPLPTLWHFSAPYKEARMVAYVEAKLPVLRKIVDEAAGVNRPDRRTSSLSENDMIFLDHRQVDVQSEISPGFDKFVSGLMSPLWIFFRCLFAGLRRMQKSHDPDDELP